MAGLADHTIDVAEGRTICSEGIASIMQEAPVNETGGNLWSCNMMVRRETFLNLGGFDEAFPNAWCEDVEFNGRVNRAALRRVFLPDAVVDHPVRRRPGGLAEGRRWESRALLWFKEGKDQPLWRWMPIHLLKVRVRQLQQQPIGYDFFAAAGSMVVEFAFVLVHLSAWQRRYEHIARP